MGSLFFLFHSLLYLQYFTPYVVLSVHFRTFQCMLSSFFREFFGICSFATFKRSSIYNSKSSTVLQSSCLQLLFREKCINCKNGHIFFLYIFSDVSLALRLFLRLFVVFQDCHVYRQTKTSFTCEAHPPVGRK